MKRFYRLFSICIILLLMICSQAFAQEDTGYCGPNDNVRYTITDEGNERTIRFYNSNPSTSGTWNDTCRKVIIDENAAAPYITNVIIEDKMAFNSTFNGGQYTSPDPALKRIKRMDLSNFSSISSTGTNGAYLFYGLNQLEELNLSGWNISGVGSMKFWFKGCSSLSVLDISGWNSRGG